jgi:acetyl esterase/lipase
MNVNKHRVVTPSALIKTVLFTLLSSLIIQMSPARAGDIYLSPNDQLMARAEKVLYKKTPQEDMYLYILRPENAPAGKPLPAVVCFTGGGWVNGDASGMIGNVAWWRDQGYIGISADYRVFKRHGTTPMESVQDAKSAIRYVRAHAKELGVDPDRIIAEGGSAGGHLAACTALTPGHDEPGEDTAVSSKANALLLHNPVLGGSGAGLEFCTAHPDCAPVRNVCAGLPPTVVSNGTKDKTTPLVTTLQFVDEMKKAGNQCELITVADADHSCDWPVTNPNFLPTLTRMRDFLKENGFAPPQAAASATQTRTSFRPGELWPDDKGVHINAHGGGVLFHDGVYYWFGEFKVGGDAGNYAQVGVGVYSSRDLYNWKNEGVALAVSNDPASEIAKGCIIERPKVIYNAKTGKFVMWFHLEFNGKGYATARAALAVSDKPAGPYKYVGSYRLNPGVWPVDATAEEKAASSAKPLSRDFKEGQMARDLTLFVDDDAKAYLIASSEDNSTLHIVQLSDDYQGFSGKWARAFSGDFNEAPALFKHDGRYYMITSGCSGWAPNAARSAVADSVFGPWTSLGNPARGEPDRVKITYGGQSTYVLPVHGKPDTLIFIGDIWNPKDAIDGRYMWLPLEWENGKPVFNWRDEWSY